MYKYETHLHTSPVSQCAKAGVEENLHFYKSLGYDGVFITNHFFGKNALPTYAEQVHYHFSDYEKAAELGQKIGLNVFCGIEMSYKGTDFLVYGPDKDWYLHNPQMMDMPIRERLGYLTDAGALVIQAHPYREAHYIDHIRLFPRSIHGVEVYNANRTELENAMAKHYAESYGLLPFAGSDNHRGAAQKNFGGISFSSPLTGEKDFVSRIKAGEGTLFMISKE